MTSTLSTEPAEDPADPRSTSSIRTSVFRRFLRNPIGVVSSAFLLLVIALALAAPILGLPDPNAVNLRNAVLPPSTEHLLGTDSSGRDILSRLLWGSRVNLLGAAIAVGIAFLIGVTTALIAGYFGGWFDVAASWVNNLMMALPGIVILLAASSVLGPSVYISMAIFGVILFPGFFRIVRGAVMVVRNELYVDAARVSGLSDLRIITRHILTVVRAPVIIQAVRLLSIGIGVQAGLEFLGVSDSTRPSWGQMLNEGFSRIQQDPILILWPCIMIAVVCISLILLGNAIRDTLEDLEASGKPKRRRKNRDSAAEATAAPIKEQPEPTGGKNSVEAPSDALLVARGLRVAYGHDETMKEVVCGVDLHVRPGEVLGLVGESGSGKTQTAFSVLGLLPQGGRVSAGSIVYDHGPDVVGISAKEHARLRGTDIAYVPQEPMSNLDPSFKIGYQLIVPIRKKLGLSKEEAQERALRLLRRVGIPDPEKTYNSYPHEISGGMAQRVLIAGAISCDPKLLIADEPTTSLDVTIQAEVLDLLRELQEEIGMAMILVTHNFGVVADICDRVAVMQHGWIVETGDTGALFHAPKHPYTRQLLDSVLEDEALRPYPFEDEILVGATAATTDTTAGK